MRQWVEKEQLIYFQFISKIFGQPNFLAPSMKLMILGPTKYTHALPYILMCPGFEAN